MKKFFVLTSFVFVKKIIILALFIFMTGCSTLPISEKEIEVTSNDGIVYGQNHAYLISPPDGWVLDNVAGVNAGLKVVLYPDGEGFESAPAIMYTHASETEEDLNSFIEKDLQVFKGLKDDLKIKTGKVISLRDDKEAVLVDIENGLSGQAYERMAFLKDGNIIVLFVLSARDEDSFDEALSPFKEFVKSYLFITSSIEVN